MWHDKSMDIKLIRPGDVLIGFLGYGPVTVVKNLLSHDNIHRITFALANGYQTTVTVSCLGPDVRMLKSMW
jgi:hypothetical protein